MLALLDIDECASSPCQHGGKCIDKRGDYECDCCTGWTGKNCDQCKFVSYKFYLFTYQSSAGLNLNNKSLGLRPQFKFQTPRNLPGVLL